MKFKKNKLETLIITVIIGIIGISLIKTFHNKMWRETEAKSQLKAKAGLKSIKTSYCIYEYQTYAKTTEKCPTPSWKPDKKLVKECLEQANSYDPPYSEKDCLAYQNK